MKSLCKQDLPHPLSTKLLTSYSKRVAVFQGCTSLYVLFNVIWQTTIVRPVKRPYSSRPCCSDCMSRIPACHFNLQGYTLERVNSLELDMNSIGMPLQGRHTARRRIDIPCLACNSRRALHTKMFIFKDF